MRYERNYTPLLLDVTPSVVYSGQQIQYHVNPKASQYSSVLPEGEPVVSEARLGGYLTDTNATMDTDYRMNQYRRDAIQAIV